MRSGLPCTRNRPLLRTTRPDPTRIGSDIDDLALSCSDHVRQHRVMKVKRSLQIYSNDLVPKIRSGLHEGLGGIPARIVDQDVNTPEPRYRVLDSLLHGSKIGNVEPDRISASS